ncbi:MAG: hypothetical protein HZA80_02090 [Candidatus Taylorbacteria bacterium]|nr:hypothetical protein [Candidatus Taylorbacteria bacterium]
MDEGLIFVLSAPSGTGKTTVVERVVTTLHPRLTRGISTTSRTPRRGEMDGVHYYFRTRSQFIELIAEGKIAEYDEFPPGGEGSFYGTECRVIEEPWLSGKHPFLALTWPGMVNLSKKYPNQVVSIFMDAESPEHIERRLRARGDLPDDKIRSRLESGAEERAQAWRFSHLVINREGQLEETVQEIVRIVRVRLATLER